MDHQSEELDKVVDEMVDYINSVPWDKHVNAIVDSTDDSDLLEIALCALGIRIEMIRDAARELVIKRLIDRELSNRRIV